MWFEIWNNPLFWWFLLAVIATGILLLALLWRQRKKVDPLDEHLDYFCRCYARGEISRENFEELKKNLREYKKQNNPTEKEISAFPADKG